MTIKMIIVMHVIMDHARKLACRAAVRATKFVFSPLQIQLHSQTVVLA